MDTYCNLPVCNICKLIRKCGCLIFSSLYVKYGECVLSNLNIFSSFLFDEFLNSV